MTAAPPTERFPRQLEHTLSPTSTETNSVFLRFFSKALAQIMFFLYRFMENCAYSVKFM